VDLLFALLFQVGPIVSIWAIIRYGPIKNRWWRGETWVGFGLFIGAIAFLIGFAGPIIVKPSANQGPLLGIFITGPIGLALGLFWGLLRAIRRRSES